MPQFVHLHVHTQYSILDGASDIQDIISRAKELEQPALAITDHGNMFGVKLFHQQATSAGIKPILGSEVYVARGSRHDHSGRENLSGYHLILLAKNLTGYHNLARLASYAYTEGFYGKPRVDFELLEKYNEGLICCSACLGGHIPQAIMKGNIEEAEEHIEHFKRIYGDDFYLEMQLHPSGNPRIDQNVYENQKMVNTAILRLAQKHGVRYMASNDVHFVRAEDAEAHDHLICLNTGADLNDPNRMRYTRQEYLKSYEEMAALFPDHPEALATTVEIADKVESYSLSHKAFMPNFPLPEDFVIEPDKLKTVYKNSFATTLSTTKSGQKDQMAAQMPQIEALIDGAESIEQIDAISKSEDINPEFEAEVKLTTAKQFLYLRHLTYQGAHRRWGENLPESTIERLEFELSTIERMGFPGYFLIVWDFIHAARQMGVAVGPGRGSAAGSAVAYCLTITNIDPIKYDLLFERFLNPERISMPDVDIDFDEDGREEVMKYVVGKYGAGRVAHIITFGTMAAKMAIRDVARVQKLPLADADKLAKLVPERPGIKLKQAFAEVPELNQERQSTNELIRNTLHLAEKLEGAVRQTGVHACGIIIAKDDLENYIPISTNKDAALFVVQYDGHFVEDVGLLKMDFLGLKTLSIIKDALDNIEMSHGIRIDPDTIPLDDAETFALYSRGDTTGLFQFESPGMKKYLRELKPNRIDDLIAMNALYRPGPIEYIPNFIARKHGREPISYDLPDMEEYLHDTYGITVYQEQVMLLSQKLAGFTKGQADTLRKAMGKKQRAVLDKMKGDFIEGATRNGHDPKVCEKIWTDWEAFASYAFNKSHSTCYAYVSYQTAYLKAHYPAEFMAALLSRNLSDLKKISFFMDECRRIGAPVKGPDVNRSMSRFSVDTEGNIRFGLAAIKGVGENAVANIIEERRTGGMYRDLFDFVERVNLTSMNRKTFESLALAGAFDSLTDFHRSRFFSEDSAGKTYIEMLLRYGNIFQSSKPQSGGSLFGDIMQAVEIQKPQMPAGEEWDPLQTLAKERELVGLYLSAHPLDKYKMLIEKMCSNSLESLSTPQMQNRDFIAAGMVTSVTHATTKKGDSYGRFTLEDFTGSHEFVLFRKDYENFRPFMFKDYQLIIRGKIRQRYAGGEFSPQINSITFMREAQENIREFDVTLDISDVTSQEIADMKKLFADNPGNAKVKIKIQDLKAGVSLPMISQSIRIEPTMEVGDFFNERQIKYAIK